MASDVVLPLWLDVGAVFVGALDAAAAAIRRNERDQTFDVVGVVALTFVGGFGGGLIRDLLLNVPIAALQTNAYLLAGLAAFGLAWVLHPFLKRARPALVVLDAFVLGLYAALGALKAGKVGLAILPIVLVGVLSGAGGTVLRDVLSGRIPALLRPTEPYALAALASATLMAVWWRVDVRPTWLGFVLAVVAGASVRVASVWRGWRTAPVRPPRRRQVRIRFRRR